MKNLLQKVAIAWIAVMGIVGLYRERHARIEQKEKGTTQHQEIVLDEFEIASFHNS